MNAWLLNAGVLWCRCWCWCYYYLFETEKQTEKVNGNEENFKYWFWFWLLSVNDFQPEESHNSHRAHSQHFIRRFCIVYYWQTSNIPISNIQLIPCSSFDWMAFYEKTKAKTVFIGNENTKHTIGQVNRSRSTTMSSRHYLLKLCWIIHFKCFFRY